MGAQTLAAALAAAVALSLTACGSSGDEGGTADEITVAVSSSPSATALRAIAPAFTEETGVQVTFVDIPYDDLATKALLAAKKPDGGYDVVQFDSPMLAPLVGGGAVLDIGGRAKASEAYALDDFPEQVREYASYRGKQYALPLSTEPYVLWRNTELFEKHSLEPPKTWGQYVANAKKLTGKDTYGSDSGFDSQTGGYYWLESLYLSGGRLLEPGTCTPDLDSAAAREATKTYLELKEYTPATAVNGGGNEMTTAFVQGNVGQMINATGYYSIMADEKQSKLDGSFEASLPPGVHDGGKTLLFGWLIGIGKNSDAPDTAWQFLEYALGKDSTAKLVEEGAPPPARTSLLDDPVAKKELPYLETLVAAAKVGDHLPYIPQMPEIITALSAELSKAATHDWSAERLTRTANAKVADILAGAESCA